ncbi:hypothetical protein ABT373_38885 [Streptomyces sp. NPDC000070]|uniref:hypothetical protein n=1 Tax=Streptomyces sp. NPDC000070 TaxID=3154240 RepID=UPI003327B403
MTTRATDALADDLAAATPDSATAHDAAAAVMARHGSNPGGLSVPTDRLQTLFGDAFTNGLHLSLLVAGVATLLATATVALMLPRQQPKPAGPPASERQPAAQHNPSR